MAPETDIERPENDNPGMCIEGVRTNNLRVCTEKVTTLKGEKHMMCSDVRE